MNLEQLRDELRITRLDDTVKPYLWSDDELKSFLNDAVRQVCLRQRALIESVYTRLCRYPVAIGQRLVKLPSEVLAIRTARWLPDSDPTNSCHPLELTTMKRLLRSKPRWEIEDNGLPQYLIPDYQEGHFALSCPPDEAGSVTMTVWRTPLAKELLCEDEDEPVINPNWHIDLLDWAEYRAFSKKDAETLDAGRAQLAEQTFTAKVGPLPSMIEVRLWGISRLVGTTAEFL